VTDVVEIAVGEIRRVAAWALRGLGMPFGVADRAAPLVTWAEAVEGEALRALRLATPWLDGPKPATWHRQESAASWTFDATGRSLLELGPVAVDLLTLAARTGHVGQVDLRNVVDPVFLSGVARLAAKRGVGLVAVSPDIDLTLCGTPVASLWAFPGPQGPMFNELALRSALAQDLGIEDRLARPASGGRGGGTITILSYRPDETRAAGESVAPRFDAEARFAWAQAHGAPVAREDIAHLYGLEMRTWAPTSERSRTQALA
jgi:hypothetical protein